MVSIEKLQDLIKDNREDVDFAVSLSDTLVEENTSDLDEIMRAINKEIVGNENVSDFTIERYLIELTNAMYFISNRCEKFGFYDDITKANARLKYNQMYSENQLNNAANGKKVTNADNQLYAEMNSIDESTLNIIYSRSVRIIKSKLESANEMIRTLSKILSVHLNDINATRMVRQNVE